MRYLVGLVLVLAFALSVAAQDFQKGSEAYLRGDYTAALREWRPLAEQGHLDAQSGLGVMYLEGQGVASDPVKAAKWLKSSASEGNASAQSLLADMYLQGNGVSRNIAEAAKWRQRAADQGIKMDQYYLGVMFMTGMGVPQDNVRAYKWLSLAKQNDPILSTSFLEAVSTQMSPAEISEAERLVREWKLKREAH